MVSMNAAVDRWLLGSSEWVWQKKKCGSKFQEIPYILDEKPI